MVNYHDGEAAYEREWSEWQECAEDFYIVQYRIRAVFDEHLWDEITDLQLTCRGPGISGESYCSIITQVH